MLHYRMLQICFFTLVLLVMNNSFGQEDTKEDRLRFSMKSEWTDDVKNTDIWNQYPRPQLDRGDWVNLNGLWKYAITPITNNIPTEYDGEIRVPFAVESELSTVKKIVDSEQLLWYQTIFSIKDLGTEERIHLNFGAVDWQATVYVNGKVVGGHKGGYTAFSLDITSYLSNQEQQELVVRVWDPTDTGTQARGKQVLKPRGIWYTPVTGIWQTVWIERTGRDYVKQLKTTTDIDNSVLKITAYLPMVSTALKMICKVTAEEKVIASQEISISAGSDLVGLEIPIPNAKLWSPENPFLYDLEISLINDSGELVDKVKSYFGMRKISLGKDANGYTRILLNNVPVFQFGLLDQGWWPDGLYTPPTEKAMMHDVEMTKKWGFNMLRKHVKVESARFYYNCDKMGMLVWQDMPNGSLSNKLGMTPKQDIEAVMDNGHSLQFEKELKEMIDQLSFSPSIVVWVPFNEGWGQYDTERIASWVESYDPSRLCDAPSGWVDRNVGSILDGHIYPGPGMPDPTDDRASVIGEFGGLGWPVKNHMWWDKKNWGYLTLSDQSKLQDRFSVLIKDLVGLKSRGLSAAIYTQTTDIEGEVNGLMTYDRKVVKIAPEVTQKLFAPLYRPAQRKRIVLKDSEDEPQRWRVSYKNNETDWETSSFNDSDWEEKVAPFGSFDNVYIPVGSHWASDKDLYARKSFYLDEVPLEINLKYFLHHAAMDIYVNGKKIASLEHERGNPQHYSNKLIEGADKFLTKGKNVIAIKVKSQEEKCSFDMGIYEAALIGAGR